MNTEGSLLKRLRQQLADLESTQRRRGTTAGAGFWPTPGPDAAEPAPGAEAPVSSGPEVDAPRPAGELPARLRIHW